MKIALLSDIHGNSIALEGVLKELKKHKVNQLLIMGDFLGYYYDHDKVFQLLDQFQWIGVQGNHDAALADFFFENETAMEKYRSSYGSSLDVALRKLKRDQIEMLIRLPEKRELVLDGKKTLICHGAPWDQECYVYPDSEQVLFDRLFGLNYDFIILGHTHYPMMKKQKGVTVINPGSVGQPRDEGNKASWAFVNFQTGEVEFRRTRFAPDEMIKAVGAYDPHHKSLKEVFMRKRRLGKENIY